MIPGRLWNLMTRLHAHSVCILLLACTTASASKASTALLPLKADAPLLLWSTAHHGHLGGEATSSGMTSALNGEPETADEEHEPNARDPWKSLACTQACEAGGEAMENFCRALPNKTSKQKAIREACWASSRASKGICIVFCNAYFGPPAKPRQ